MLVVAAPDKFRGTASAAEVAGAIAEAAEAAGWECTVTPMADGGEGTLDALGGPNRRSTVSGPMGDPVAAAWRLDGRTAIIEMAEAAGLTLAGGADGNDAIAASTHGVGELIRIAVESGATKVIVGVGGSATTDGGLGALRALYPHPRLRGVELVVACDVRTTFVDAASHFGPQKGASAAQVRLLTNRLERLVDVYRMDHGVDVRDIVGGGAAGGLAGGLAALGATLVPGAMLVAEELGVDLAIADADLVITGEGFLDEESFAGKVVDGVLTLAAAEDTPAAVIVGEVLDGVTTPAGVAVVSLVERFGRDASLGDTLTCVRRATTELLAARTRNS